MPYSELDYLKDENERLREKIRQEDESRERRREEQRRQREEERRESLMRAGSWEEAFRTNVLRMNNELLGCESDLQFFVSDLEDCDRESYRRMIEGWRRDIAANERAAAIVREKLASVEEECRKLRLAALAEAADAVDAEFPKNDISRFLREDDKDGLLYW